MKGVNYMIVAALLFAVIVFAVAFVYWEKISTESKKSATDAIYGPEGVYGGVVLLAPLSYALRNSLKRKGIVVTTNMMVTIIFFLMVALVIFMIWTSLRAEAGSSTNSILFGFFDSLIGRLP